MIKTTAGIVFSVIIFFAACALAEDTLKLATTTSTYETGILDYILPPFEQEYGVTVHIISVGTGKALKLGENGDVDIILVHAREAEERFVRDGYGIARRGVMHNDFVIMGPKNDPAKISKLSNALEAFERIYDTGSTFISRGDDSGTNKKERYLWAKLGLEPTAAWYLETGQGMGATLRVADEKDAYVLVDRATYLYNKGKIRLVKLVEGDEELFNPYGVIAVNPHRHPHVKYDLAMALIEWLVSPECRKMIDAYKVGGEQLFHANPIH